MSWGDKWPPNVNPTVGKYWGHCMHSNLRGFPLRQHHLIPFQVFSTQLTSFELLMVFSSQRVKFRFGIPLKRKIEYDALSIPCAANYAPTSVALLY